MMDPSDSSNNVYHRNNVKIFNISWDVFFFGNESNSINEEGYKRFYVLY